MQKKDSRHTHNTNSNCDKDSNTKSEQFIVSNKEGHIFESRIKNILEGNFNLRQSDKIDSKQNNIRLIFFCIVDNKKKVLENTESSNKEIISTGNSNSEMIKLIKNPSVNFRDVKEFTKNPTENPITEVSKDKTEKIDGEKINPDFQIEKNSVSSNKTKSQKSEQMSGKIEYNKAFSKFFTITNTIPKYFCYFDLENKILLDYNKDIKNENFVQIEITLSIKDNKQEIKSVPHFSGEQEKKFNQMFPSGTGAVTLFQTKEIDGIYVSNTLIEYEKIEKNAIMGFISPINQNGYSIVLEDCNLPIEKDVHIIVECKNGKQLDKALFQTTEDYFYIRDVIKEEELIFLIVLSESPAPEKRNFEKIKNSIKKFKNCRILVLLCINQEFLGYNINQEIYIQDNAVTKNRLTAIENRISGLEIRMTGL